jgi:hypothetical protein
MCGVIVVARLQLRKLLIVGGNTGAVTEGMLSGGSGAHKVQHNPMTPKHAPHTKVHHSHLSSGPSALRNPISKRRSNRMLLSAAVWLSGQDKEKAAFASPARATNLNKHGAAVQLSRELVVGSVVSVRNQRGAEISARVVAQLRAAQGVCTYGLEFVEQNDKAAEFWGISFPTNS